MLMPNVRNVAAKIMYARIIATKCIGFVYDCLCLTYYNLLLIYINSQ